MGFPMRWIMLMPDQERIWRPFHVWDFGRVTRLEKIEEARTPDMFGWRTRAGIYAAHVVRMGLWDNQAEDLIAPHIADYSNTLECDRAHHTLPPGDVIDVGSRGNGLNELFNQCEFPYIGTIHHHNISIEQDASGKYARKPNTYCPDMVTSSILTWVSVSQLDELLRNSRDDERMIGVQRGSREALHYFSAVGAFVNAMVGTETRILFDFDY